MTANYYLDRLKKDYASTADRLQAMDNDISKDTRRRLKNRRWR
ncbi:Uncharacterised protein [Klebsiella pneumoniae]|nr:Uncharacterised protein [Klebsiella pneumoniae]